MFLAYIYLTGFWYLYATSIFLQLQLWYQIADIIMMIGVINGDTTRDLYIDIGQPGSHINSVFPDRYFTENQKTHSWQKKEFRTPEHR